MKNKVEDLEKSMKRSNDKQLKIELECCLKVWFSFLEFYFCCDVSSLHLLSSLMYLFALFTTTIVDLDENNIMNAQ